jgi:SSS family transporter
VPAYFRGELFTSYQLLQRRFGSRVKTLAAGIFLVTRTLADGVRLFATALVIAVVTDVPVGWTVVVLGVAMIVYTTRGGVSAVIWTDVVQMFIYLAGAAAVGVALFARIPGGWGEIVASGVAAGKFTAVNLAFDPNQVYTLWAGLLGGVALTLATHGTDQFLVQRLLSARSPRDAQVGLVASGFIVFTQFTLFLLIGVMLFVFYQHAPAPALSRTDEILPRFVILNLSGGVAGFIVAAIVAAALSPSLNAMAATTVNDFYRRFARPDVGEAALMRVSRLATIGWGIAQIVVAVAAQWMDRSVLDAGLAVLSLASGPVLGAFLVGVLSRTVNESSMLTGMIAGAAVLLGVWWTGAAAWTWWVFVGASVTSLVALVVSSLERWHSGEP